MWSEQIEQQGFALILGILQENEVAALLHNLADLDHRRSRAGVRHTLSHPAVKTIANDFRLLSIARGILGQSAFPFRATLFDKSPEANWLITWHQDTALPMQEKCATPGWGPWSVKEGVIYAHAPASALEQVLAVRLHLDDSMPQNGPLRVLAGTHRLGVLSDAQVEQEAAARQSVECLVPCGGVLAMRPLLIHASSKSKSPAARRVLHIEYAAKAQVGEGMQLSGSVKERG